MFDGAEERIILVVFVLFKFVLHCCWQVHDYTRRLVETNLAKPEDMYFTCLVERGTAAMTVHVVLGTDYPNCTSLMVLALKWRSTIRTALNDEAIRVSRYLLSLLHDWVVLPR